MTNLTPDPDELDRLEHPETVFRSEPSVSRTAPASALTNEHQKIQNDRIGYVRIRLDFAEKALKNQGFLADSDPRLQL